MSLPVVTQRPWSGFAIVGFAYVIALLVGHTVITVATRFWPTLAAVAVADVAATIVVFVFSRAFNNSSVYDPYWSVAPAPIALALADGALGARQAVLLVLITAYGIRLTYNWARGWAGLGHEDWRYVDIRNKTGKAYWVASFFALHFFPTVMVFLGCLPLAFAMNSSAPLGALDALGAVITAAAITIEGVADNQLRAHRQSHAAKEICESGLWHYSRHPNYFGEISFWAGLWVFGLAAGAPSWAVVGILAMIGLFAGASIPMAEKRSLARRPHYAEHQKRVSMLIPWFRKS